MSAIQLAVMREANEMVEEMLAHHTRLGNHSLVDYEADELDAFVKHVFNGMIVSKGLN